MFLIIRIRDLWRRTRSYIACVTKLWFVQMVLTATMTAIITVYASHKMWVNEQIELQEWNSKPVVKVSLQAYKDRKNLIITNLGQVDIDDVEIFLTKYELKADWVNGEHEMFNSKGDESIENIYKIGGGPILKFTNIQKLGGVETINLLALAAAPMYKFDPLNHKLLTSYYVFRITFRNAVTKKRYITYCFTNIFKDWSADFFGDPETIDIGGGYNAEEEMIKLKKELIQNQMDFFDDPAEEIYN
jgi:hypothetical protein